MSMQKKIVLNGLRSCLRRFDEDGFCSQTANWQIAKGGYDLNWQLYYHGIPVFDCVCGQLINDCLDDVDFKRVASIICSEYQDCRL